MIHMASTKIAASVTAGQIQSLLARAGASAIQLEYDAGEIRGLAFIIRLTEKNIPFRLPIRWAPGGDQTMNGKGERGAMNLICKILGHKWHWRDLTEYNLGYPGTCLRCGRNRKEEYV